MKSSAELREAREDDWPAILALANQSVAGVSGAGPQDEWLRNRRRPHPLRRELVALESDAVVGYAALEAQLPRIERSFRLFVVSRPERLAEIGALLYRRVEGLLAELGAAEAWFVEYASDQRLLAFLAERGFEEVRRLHVEGEGECVVVSKRMDVASPRAGRPIP